MYCREKSPLHSKEKKDMLPCLLTQEGCDVQSPLILTLLYISQQCSLIFLNRLQYHVELLANFKHLLFQKSYTDILQKGELRAWTHNTFTLKQFTQILYTSKNDIEDWSRQTNNYLRVVVCNRCYYRDLPQSGIEAGNSV